MISCWISCSFVHSFPRISCKCSSRMPSPCMVDLVTNQRQVLVCVNQSETSITCGGIGGDRDLEINIREVIKVGSIVNGFDFDIYSGGSFPVKLWIIEVWTWINLLPDMDPVNTFEPRQTLQIINIVDSLLDNLTHGQDGLGSSLGDGNLGREHQWLPPVSDFEICFSWCLTTTNQRWVLIEI